MPAVVHLVPRLVAAQPSPLARDLANPPWSATPQGAVEAQWPNPDTARLAVICLSESLSAPVRAHLRLELEALSRPEVRVEVYDESEVPQVDRAARRSAAAAMITRHDATLPWPCAFLEAMTQAIPLVILGNIPSAAPKGVMFTGPRHADDRAVAIIRSWMSSWTAGEAPNVDVAARSHWLAELHGR